MNSIIESLVEKEDMSIDKAYGVMDRIMSGKISDPQLAGILIAMKSKGETPEEIAGFVRAMRDKSVGLSSDFSDAIDVCGTGGDYSGTFNISTAAAFVAAGAGVKVAKHGNRSISSKSGSADVLASLGIDINMPREKSEEALDKIGIAFLYAPQYHPAMKYAAPVRKALGIKTVFNLLGPLTNPARTKRQLVGVYSKDAALLLSQTAGFIGMQTVCFVCTEDRYDEVSLCGSTTVNEYSSGMAKKPYEISGASFGYPDIEPLEIQGGDAEMNAGMISRLFRDKEKNAVFFVTAANAAMALYCAGVSDSISECRMAAEESILSGRAMEKLEQLKNI